MKIEYLDKIGYIGGNLHGGFIIDVMGNGIDDIKKTGKKIILFGAGENSFFAEMLLLEKGLEIYGYADNSLKLQGQFLRGKEIFNPYDCFKWEDVYFIITTQLRRISDIRLQFMAHKICDYGIFLNASFHDFSDEDMDLQILLMEAINEICFREESAETVLPYGEWENGKLGDCYWLLKSTRWSHWAYIWEKDILTQNGSSILEIGPGFGLMSFVLLKEFLDIKIDWVVLEEESRLSLSEINDEFISGLMKVKKWYGTQINEICGKIERRNFVLQENKYDLIIMTEVFEHFVLNPLEVMRKICSSLADSGVLILTTPNWGHVHIYKCWEDMPKDEEVDDERYRQLLGCGHTYQYNKEELDDIFVRCGFEVVKYKVSDSNNHNYMLRKLNRGVQ